MPVISDDVKLGGYEFYHKILKSPRYVVAPMVDQSELAWRTLSRRYGADLVYTPMINAKLFIDPRNPRFQTLSFDIPNGEEGSSIDRPLIVQFCGNDPEILLKAARIIERHCDAVDINLGCPQDIARRGHYGCFLQDDWDLVYRIINILHINLSIPVTAKFRVFPTVEKTVAYAKMMESAGAQILTCHGRLREQRGVNSGLADWDKVRAVKEAVKVPVFANGNILYASDVIRCLQYTGADGVMSAEGQLYNPALFAALPRQITQQIFEKATSTNTSVNPADFPSYAVDMLAHPPNADLALEYLEIVKSLKTATALSAVKGHLFKIMKPSLGIETDLRDRLGKVRGGSRALIEYEEICREMKARLQAKTESTRSKSLVQLVQVDPTTGMATLPQWLAQPYIRPLPPASCDKSKSGRDVRFMRD